VQGENTQETTLNGSLLLGGKDGIVMKVTSPTEESELISNGTTLYLYQISEKSYIEVAAPPARQQILGMMAGGALRMGSQWLAAFLHGDEALLAAVKNPQYRGIEKLEGAVPCHHLLLPDDKSDTEIWLDAGEKPLLHRFKMDFAKLLKSLANPNMPDGVLVEFSFDHWQPNAPAPAERFAFVPPQGVRRQEHPAPMEDKDPMAGRPAPDFKLELLDGGSMELAQHKGKEVVILDFWASWCGPCRTALPGVAEVAAAYKEKGVAFYAVNLKESADRVRSFLERMDLEIPVALDKDGRVGNLYGAQSIPRMVIIGKDGMVHTAHTGLNPNLKQQLPVELDAALAEE